MDIIELIRSCPGYAEKTDAQLVEWLQGGSGQYRSTYVDARSIMAHMGAINGAAFLTKLEDAAPQIPAVRWALKFLEGDGLDIGNPETRGMVTVLQVAGVITADEATSVLSMAVEKTHLEAAGITTISQAAFNMARAG